MKTVSNEHYSEMFDTTNEVIDSYAIVNTSNKRSTRLFSCAAYFLQLSPVLSISTLKPTLFSHNVALHFALTVVAVA